jgi:hypothetical protein
LLLKEGQDWAAADDGVHRFDPKIRSILSRLMVSWRAAFGGALGDAIYLYTDGVTEAANKNDELFTEARLEAILRGTVGRPTSAIQ